MNQGISIVIPALNEEENIPKVLDEIKHFFDNNNYEMIVIDDFSDKKLEEALDIDLYPNLVISRNTFRLGQSKSILNGIKLASFNTIGLIDGDGQNPPSELKKLYERYLNEDNNEIAVIGRRLNRKDSISKKIPSNIANLLLRFLTKTKSKDLGCSLKIFSKRIKRNIKVPRESVKNGLNIMIQAATGKKSLVDVSIAITPIKKPVGILPASPMNRVAGDQFSIKNPT